MITEGHLMVDITYIWLPALAFAFAIPLWRGLLAQNALAGVWFADWLREKGLWREAQRSLAVVLFMGALLGIGFNNTVRQVAGVEPPDSAVPSVLGQLVMTGFLTCAAFLRLLKKGGRSESKVSR